MYSTLLYIFPVVPACVTLVFTGSRATLANLVTIPAFVTGSGSCSRGVCYGYYILMPITDVFFSNTNTVIVIFGILVTDAGETNEMVA